MTTWARAAPGCCSPKQYESGRPHTATASLNKRLCFKPDLPCTHTTTVATAPMRTLQGTHHCGYCPFLSSRVRQAAEDAGQLIRGKWAVRAPATSSAHLHQHLSHVVKLHACHAQVHTQGGWAALGSALTLGEP